MSTYRLDETPNTFLSGVIQDGSYIFRLNYIEDESKHNFLRDIDLRKDKLIVYGTEINESNREKLHNSLIIRPLSVGDLCVNCNGACFIYIVEKEAYYRLIDNVIFDWSLFGVTVPNSVADLSRKEKRQKEEELAATSSLLSSVMSEASATKDGWDAAKQEIVDLQNQLISSKNEKKSLEMELQMVQRHLSSTVFGLLKASKIIERVAELEERVSVSKRECEDVKGKVETMEDRVSSVESNLELTTTMNETAKKIAEKFDCLISAYDKDKENIEDIFAKLLKIIDHTSSEEKKEDDFTFI